MNAHGDDSGAGARAFVVRAATSDAIAATRAMPGQYFAIHLDSLAPQGLPAFIHRLVRRSSTPAVDDAGSAIQYPADAAVVDFARGGFQHFRRIALGKAHAEMHFAAGCTRGVDRGQADAMPFEYMQQLAQ